MSEKEPVDLLQVALARLEESRVDLEKAGKQLTLVEQALEQLKEARERDDKS